jgi:hypothetical protein
MTVLSKRRKPKRKVLTTRVTAAEARQFAKVTRYVRGFCGPVSAAEVLRFLIRNWSGA